MGNLIQEDMIPIIIDYSKKSDLDYYLNENFSDHNLIELNKLEQPLTIDLVRNLKREVFHFRKDYLTIVINDLEFSPLTSQQALLKLLEEPPEKIQFVITTKRLAKILPTIVSRAQIIRIKKFKEPKKNQKNLEELASNFLKEKKMTKDEVLDLIDLFIDYLRDICLDLQVSDKKDYLSLLKESLKIRELLISNNLNSTLALDHLLILFSKKFNINSSLDYNQNERE